MTERVWTVSTKDQAGRASPYAEPFTFQMGESNYLLEPESAYHEHVAGTPELIDRLLRPQSTYHPHRVSADEGEPSFTDVVVERDETVIRRQVWSARYSPDGQYLALALLQGGEPDDKALLHVFRTSDWSLILAPNGDPGWENTFNSIQCMEVVWSPDGAYLALIGGSSRLHIIDTETWTIAKDEIIVNNLTSADFSDNYLVATRSTSPFLELFNISDWEEAPVTLPMLQGAARMPRFSPDQSILAVSNDATSIELIDTSDWSLIENGPTLGVGAGRQVGWSLEGDILALTGISSPRLRLYDTSTWNVIPGAPSLSITATSPIFSRNYLTVGASIHTNIYRKSDWSLLTQVSNFNRFDMLPTDEFLALASSRNMKVLAGSSRGPGLTQYEGPSPSHGTVRAEGSLEASGESSRESAGELRADGAVVGTSQTTRTASGEVATDASIAGAGSAPIGGTGEVAGEGHITGTARATTEAAGEVTAEASIEAAGHAPAKASGELSAIGHLDGASYAPATASGEVVTEGTLSATGAADDELEGSGEIVASGLLEGEAKTLHTASGQVAAVGSLAGVGFVFDPPNLQADVQGDNVLLTWDESVLV